MTREWKSLKDPKVFLQSRLSMRRDMSLISQVELWAINRRVFEYFGADVESTAASQRLADLEQLNQAYDKWHQDWINMLVVNDQRGGLSQRLSDLYFECAKLHLFSHVFRGPPQAQSSTLSPGGTDHLAQQAYRSALAVVRIAVEGHKSFGWLQRLPFYFGPMIAFACVCIVKASQEHRLDEIQRQEGLSYLYQLPTELRTISMAGTAPHPLLSIAKSLETAVNSHLLSTNDNSERLDGEVWNDIQLDFDILSSEAANWNWNFPAFDDQWMMCPDDVDMLQNNQV